MPLTSPAPLVAATAPAQPASAGFVITGPPAVHSRTSWGEVPSSPTGASAGRKTATNPQEACAAGS
eukprot:3573230-Lingulodinium_polyedra.AAC.1